MTPTKAQRDNGWMRAYLANWENEGGAVAVSVRRRDNAALSTGPSAMSNASPAGPTVAESLQIADPFSLIIMRNSLLILIPAMGLIAALSAIISSWGAR